MKSGYLYLPYFPRYLSHWEVQPLLTVLAHGWENTRFKAHAFSNVTVPVLTTESSRQGVTNLETTEGQIKNKNKQTKTTPHSWGSFILALANHSSPGKIIGTALPKEVFQKNPFEFFKCEFSLFLEVRVLVSDRCSKKSPQKQRYLFSYSSGNQKS